METIQYKDKTITFIPTAHVSAQSAIEVKETIETLQPDTVCVELDRQRANALTNKEAYQNTDIIKIIKEKKVSLFIINLFLSAYQKRLARKLNVNVGSEMVAAIETGKQQNAKIEYIDRSIQVTFNRMLRSLSFWEKCKLITAFIFSNDENDITNEDIEKMKEQDVLESALYSISDTFPTIKKVILDERNEVMAYHIKKLTGKNIVVVIGAAHLQGIIEALDHDQDIKTLNEVPPKGWLSRILPWVIPGLLLLMILFVLFQNWQIGIHSFGNWMILSTVLATVGAIITFSHPMTILVTALTTWLGAIHPFLAVGWFAGLTEAKYRKPKIKDFENLADDITSFHKARKNAVIHILAVVIMTNLMSTIGTLISGLDIFRTFFNLF